MSLSQKVFHNIKFDIVLDEQVNEEHFLIASKSIENLSK